MKKIIKRVNLFVEPELWMAFSAKCRKNNTTMTQVLLRAVRDYLKGGEK